MTKMSQIRWKTRAYIFKNLIKLKMDIQEIHAHKYIITKIHRNFTINKKISIATKRKWHTYYRERIQMTASFH